MKRILLLLLFSIAWMQPSLAQDTAAKLTITHLAGEFYVYTTYKILNGSPFPSNSMYVLTDSGIVMVDTPWDDTQTDLLVDSLQRRHDKNVIACIVTHYHDDRTAGLDVLNRRGIKTFSSYETRMLCVQKSEKVADYYFNKDTIFHFGSHTLHTFYPGEGHTKDNIVIWFPEDKVLYGGCLVKSTESQGLGNIADANVKAWPATIKKVISKYPHPNYVIPGHFGWQSTGSLKHTLKLLR